MLKPVDWVFSKSYRSPLILGIVFACLAGWQVYVGLSAFRWPVAEATVGKPVVRHKIRMVDPKNSNTSTYELRLPHVYAVNNKQYVAEVVVSSRQSQFTPKADAWLASYGQMGEYKIYYHPRKPYIWTEKPGVRLFTYVSGVISLLLLLVAFELKMKERAFDRKWNDYLKKRI